MSSNFTINGHTANLAATQKAFTAAGFNGKALQGGDLTPDKIAQVLHPDGKPVTMEDLRRLQSDSSSSLRKLLQSNGVNLYEATSDFDKTLSQYFQDQFANGKPNTNLIPDKMWENPDFVRRAVKYSGTALQYASKKLKDDPETVLIAVKSDGLALQYASERLQKNPEIVTEAVKNNYQALEHAAPSLKSNPTFVLSMIQKTAEDPNIDKVVFVKEIIGVADPKVKENATLMLEAGKIDPDIFELIPENLKKDKKFVIEMVKVSGIALAYVDPTLQKDPEVVMEAVKQDGYALAYADSSIKRNNLDIIKVAVRQSNKAFQHIHPDLKQEQSVLVTLALINHNILGELGPIRREKVWNDLQPILAKKGIQFPQPMMTNYETFKAGLLTMTDAPERFRSFKTIQTYWDNRKKLNSYTGNPPSALVVYPPKKGDLKESFSDSPVLDDLAESGKFYVLYAEASFQAQNGDSKKQQVLEALKEASLNEKYPIHTFILGGHGTGKLLILGKENIGDEIYNVDIDDFKTGLKEISKYLNPRGQMLIDSCYSGKGEEKGENLENAAANILPNTFRLVGYRKSTSTSGFLIDQDLTLRPQISPELPYITYGKRPPTSSTQQVAGATTQRRLSGI